ncbi:MAG: quinolinate synthase [Nitrospiraceae bacterium]|nr:quinolinate synthase [Nitrospiraceae bacterium]|tara:strand:- start:3837 stop:4952 length:1116 start_codon:yes stop_codon:yes gene_type:complete
MGPPAVLHKVAREIQEYQSFTPEEIHERTVQAKELLGNRLVILGHNYQRDEVIEFSDFQGDSLKLARISSELPDREYIVFCGVSFMAETADILSSSDQAVVLPDLAAGCSMADMADLEHVEMVWDSLRTLLPVEELVMPVVYVNSAADLKAFCGKHGGITCTSSNAQAVFRWAFERREKILFFPDEHLGRYTAKSVGLQESDLIVWDPYLPNGGHTPEAIRHATVLLWKGFCSVHLMFRPEHVRTFRSNYPDLQVIVHPECCEGVVEQADLVGSTELIIQTVSDAASGTVWAIGTELNLVNRLKRLQPDKKIFFLSPTVCQCSTMFRIDPIHLLWSLENLVDGHVVNRISVPADDKLWAGRALDRMMSVGC